MAGILIDTFRGMLPRYGVEQLPDGYAETAIDCLLLSGELRPLHRPERVGVVHGNTTRAKAAFNLIDDTGADGYYYGFSDPFVSLVRAPLVNDAYNRYYWTSDVDVPRYAPFTNIESGGTLYKLGVPPPTDPCTVTPSGAGTAYRAYTYTFVSSFGEESATPGATVAEGDPANSWTIGGMDSTVPDSTDRTITGKHVYRTVVAADGSVEYYRVTTDPIAISLTTYVDSAPDSEVLDNPQLESANWDPPPNNLRGLVAHANGFLAGYVDQTVYLSVPYRPHAWPLSYALAIDSPIVGLETVGDSILIMTRSYAYSYTGNVPSAMAFRRVTSVPRPCLSRRGIVAAQQGVIFPSSDGLVMATATAADVITAPIITKDEWNSTFAPSNIIAAIDEASYVAYFSARDGFYIALTESPPYVGRMRSSVDIDALRSDSYKDEVIALSNNEAIVWNPANGAGYDYTWRSKVYVVPNPTNLSSGIIHVIAESPYSEETLNSVRAWNAERISLHPLGPVNGNAVNMAYPVLMTTEPPLGLDAPHTGDPSGQVLFNVSGLSDFGNAYVSLTLIADEYTVFNGAVPLNTSFRLPGGYKASRFQVEIRSNVAIRRVLLGSTGLALKGA